MTRFWKTSKMISYCRKSFLLHYNYIIYTFYVKNSKVQKNLQVSSFFFMMHTFIHEIWWWLMFCYPGQSNSIFYLENRSNFLSSLLHQNTHIDFVLLRLYCVSMAFLRFSCNFWIKQTPIIEYVCVKYVKKIEI